MGGRVKDFCSICNYYPAQCTHARTRGRTHTRTHAQACTHLRKGYCRSFAFGKLLLAVCAPFDNI